jgi:hypothetical protein
MCGGYDNVLNTARRIMDLSSVNYQQRAGGGAELERLDYRPFLFNDSVSSVLFNNLQTLSLQFTLPFLPSNVKHSLRARMSEGSLEDLEETGVVTTCCATCERTS